ncbi:MAG: pantetheine-phosphate adenylyltransferase [Clostridia bacterium]|nr:pantetheine-phosphate adenylyltransferase [Clostridia bacterium]
MNKAFYPGSFDPVTYGHLDIIIRAAKIFDDLTVSVLNNKEKSPLFSVEERVTILTEVTKDIKNIHIDSFEGLLVDYAKQNNSSVIIRGLRAITDFDYELQMAQTNKKLFNGLDTVFLTTGLEYAYLSSHTVKQVAAFGGDIKEFVPPYVADLLYEKYKRQES